MSHFLATEDDIFAFKHKLEEALGEGYEVETYKEVSSLYGAAKEIFDLVVFYHGDAICGIEYKYRFGGSSFYDIFQGLFLNKLKKVGLRIGIEYFGEEKELNFWTSGAYAFERFSFDDMVVAIKGNQTCGERLAANIIKAEFTNRIPVKLNDCLGIDRVNELLTLFNDDNLNYHEKSATIWLNQEAEDAFFRILLRQNEFADDINHVCRYSSLNSLFLIMKNESYVMCSITCMNDKGETSYADKYVGYGAYANSSNSIKENNDCFILSCCNKDMVDNLTMWRLYGNDGKGICLEYDVDLSKIDNNEFFYGPVSYGVSVEEHPVLDFIRKIRHWRKSGWRFEMKRWYIWKHFFKSHLFKEENEVRLLYIWKEKDPRKVEWIMDSTNNIASRICIIPITDDRFPLTITNAVIGPKCPDQCSNVDQFNYMNKQKNTMKEHLFRPAVRASKIEDYR